MSSVTHARRGWLWRWTRRFVALLLCIAALLAVLWLCIRPTLAQVAVAIAHRLLPDIALEIGDVRRVAADHLLISGLRVKRRDDQREIVTLGKVSVLASWSELSARRVREIRLESPHVEITQALLDALAGDKSAREPAQPGWSIGRLTIDGGEVGVKVAPWPAIDFLLDAQLTEIRTGGAAGVSTAKQHVQLRELRVQPEDGARIVSVPRAEATFTWPELIGHQRFAALQIFEPEIRYDDSVHHLLEGGAPAPPGGAPRGSPAASQELRPPWRISRLQVIHGRMALEDLGPQIPAVGFGLEADLREVPLGHDPASDEQQIQSVTIRGVEVRAPDGEGEPFLRTPALHARFRWRELLEDHWINAVEIDRPSLTWDAAAQRAMQHSSASAGDALASPSPAAEPFRIGILQIARATVSARELGASIPDVTFGADAGMTEVPLGVGAGEFPDAEQAVSIREFALRLPGNTGAPFLAVPAIYGTFTWRGLLSQKRIGTVRIEQPELRYEPVVGRTLAGQPEAPKSATARQDPERAWHVDELALFDGKVHLADLGLGMPPIDFGLNTAFQNLALSLEGDAARNELQTIELHHIGLQSPVDPFTAVLNLPTLFIRFTPAGLWRRQVEQIEIIHPVLNVGEDLFWYIDRVQARDEGTAPDDPAPPPADSRGWTVNRFDVTSGQLVLAFQGHPKLPLPLPFETHARALNFAKLSELRLTLDLTVPEQDYIYPDYELTLRRVSGHLQFSLPPQEHANNLVHTLQVAEVRWKDYRARDLFVDVTFDEKAIHGNLGGKAYAGYLRGAFDFGLEEGSAWNGWVSGTKVDLKGLTDAFAPDKLSLSGPADFTANVAARAKVIDKFEGDFKGRGAGELHIGKLDDILRELPPEWTAVKRGFTRIGLETVRDFSYDKANGDFRFNGRTGRATLDLRGPGGSREFEALVHDDDARPGGRSSDDAGVTDTDPQPRRRRSSALQPPSPTEVQVSTR